MKCSSKSATIENDRNQLDPTPDEIKRWCQAIQKKWTPEERQQRAVAARNAIWALPVGSLRLPGTAGVK